MTFTHRDLIEEARKDLGSILESQPGLKCGIDLVDLQQFDRDLRLGGSTFLDRIFTASERAFCAGRPERLAARFAAKEAFSKALGTGMRGIGWQEIEVKSEISGRPVIVLDGRAADLARTLDLVAWDLSLTHAGDMAMAVVIARTGNTLPHTSEQS